MLQHAFVPLGVEHAGACFKSDLFGQTAHHAIALRLVHHIHRWCARGVAIALVFGLQHCAADATQRVKVSVNAGHAQLNRIDVLIGQRHIGQHVLQQIVVAHRLSTAAVGKPFARGEGVAQLIFVVPTTCIDQMVHIGTVGTFGIAKHAHRRCFHVATKFGQIGEGMFAHKVALFGFVCTGR